MGNVPTRQDGHQGDPLAKLATAIANLSPADGAKLAAMLVAKKVEAITDSQQ